MVLVGKFALCIWPITFFATGWVKCILRLLTHSVMYYGDHMSSGPCITATALISRYRARIMVRITWLEDLPIMHGWWGKLRTRRKPIQTWGEICKLYTKRSARSKNWTHVFLLWSKSANHSLTVPPTLCPAFKINLHLDQRWSVTRNYVWRVFEDLCFTWVVLLLKTHFGLHYISKRY